MRSPVSKWPRFTRTGRVICDNAMERMFLGDVVCMVDERIDLAIVSPDVEILSRQNA